MNGAAFRDVTGLAGTRQGARDALSQSYATTTRFGEPGAALSMKKLEIAGDAIKMLMSCYTGVPFASGGGKGADDIKKRIAGDAAGRISDQQARELTAQGHLIG